MSGMDARGIAGRIDSIVSEVDSSVSVRDLVAAAYLSGACDMAADFGAFARDRGRAARLFAGACPDDVDVCEGFASAMSLMERVAGERRRLAAMAGHPSSDPVSCSERGE